MKFAPTFKNCVDERVAIYETIPIANDYVKCGILEGRRRENIFLFYRAEQFQTKKKKFLEKNIINLCLKVH